MAPVLKGFADIVPVEWVRLFLLTLLLVVILADHALLAWVDRPDAQFILAIAVVLAILFYDVVCGFLLGVIVIVMYFRHYIEKYGISVWDWASGAAAPNGAWSMKPLVERYITPQHLEAAQSNTVADKAQQDIDYRGVRGVYGESVYGAQGLGGNGAGMLAGYEAAPGSAVPV